MRRSVGERRAQNMSFFGRVAFNAALGIETVSLEPGFARMRLPYRADLVGNPATGDLHGGAITALMDACCGAAVFMSLQEPAGVATLDLRIDYLRASRAPTNVVAEARTIRTTSNVAFVQATAFEDDANDPIAMATAAFMVGTAMSAKGS